MNIAKNALAGLILMSATTAFAQTGKPGFNETVIVTSGYKPRLADAVKIDVVPVPDVQETPKPEITYKTPAFIYNTTPYKVQLKTLTFTPPVEPLNRMYTKLMFGNYSDINGEIIYNTLRSRTSLFTIKGKHHSGNGPVDNSRFSENLVDLYGKKIFKGHSLTGNLGFARNANRFYAQLPDTSDRFDTTSVKQRFNDIYFDTKLAKIKGDTGKFTYGAGLGFYNFSDFYKTGETGFKLGVNGVEPFRGSRIHADASFQYWKYKMLGDILDSSIDRSLFKLGAGYNFTTNGFRADVGFNTASDEDGFHFFPNANIEADLVAKYLTVFGGITGNVHENTFKQYAYENPFVVSTLNLKNTTERLNLFGGAKGSFSSNSTFAVGLSYKNYKYLPFYLNDSVDARRFSVAYDSNTTVFNFHAEAGISIMENFTLGAGFNYNSYNLSSLAKPYHRPNMDAVITGKYVFANKIAIGADLFFAGTRYGGAWDQDSATRKYVVKETKLSNIIDLNTNVSYAFGGNMTGLKAHLALKNILGTKYQLWNYYPTRGFQISGGVSYSFL